MRLVALAVLSAALLVGQDWPQFRGNPLLTGVTSSTLGKPLKLLWSFEAGDAIESSPAIAGGAVYVGSATGDLVSLDLATGKVRWKYKAAKDLGIGESSPAVAGGTVYVGDLDGTFHAVDVQTGKARWTFKTMGEIKSSPVVAGDRVLIGSYDGALYCLAARDGKLLWKFQTENYVHGTPAVVEGIAYISGCDEKVRGIRISDGAEQFAFPSGGYTGASPAVAGSIAYFGNFNNEVVAVDLKSHKILWRYEHPERHFPFYSSAAIVDGRIVLGGRDKMVHCLDRTGKPLWTFQTRARIDSSPAVSGGIAYIGSNDGRIYGLDVKTGAKVWEYEAGSAVSSSPAIAGGKLVVGSVDGRLLCFGS